MKTAVDLLGGIHGEPENDGFHKQNLDYLRFQVYRTINKAKINLSMSDINVWQRILKKKVITDEKLLLTSRIKATKLMKQRETWNIAADNVLSLNKNITNVSLVIKIDVT